MGVEWVDTAWNCHATGGLCLLTHTAPCAQLADCAPALAARRRAQTRAAGDLAAALAEPLDGHK